MGYKTCPPECQLEATCVHAAINRLHHSRERDSSLAKKENRFLFLSFYLSKKILNTNTIFYNIQLDEFTKILLLSETYRRPIGDLLETHGRPIGHPSEIDMPHQRPIRDRHASLETHQRPTCLIGDRHASLETGMPYRRPTCLIKDRHASSETHKKYISCLT